jgi:hypothetical protein
VATAMSFQNGLRDLLLVLVVAAGSTVAGAFVTGSIMSEATVPVANAAGVTTGPETPRPTVSRPGASICRCRVPGRFVTAGLPGSGLLGNLPPAVPRSQSLAMGTRAEAGSFAAWQRAESDPRRILARLAALSRNAPPKHATDPGSGFDAPEVR